MNYPSSFIVSLLILGSSLTGATTLAKPLNVVTTLPDYAFIAKEIGGPRIKVQAIVRGEQDAHYIRPKPSFVSMVRKADVLIDTGLDLEMWLPTVVDKSGNTHVRSGQAGYIAAAKGIPLLEKPQTVSRIEGGVHLYGNPHITSSPINMRIVAQNIATGLIKNDSEGKADYEQRRDAFIRKIDVHLFGKSLVDLLGGDTLAGLASKGRLYGFLEEQVYNGTPMIDLLDGWMKQMLPLRQKPIVTYHKNWVYFARLFELEEAGTIETKPGIPPSPRHVLEITSMMEKRHINVILAANYFDEQKIKTVATRVNAQAVIVPIFTGGAPGTDSYFDLVDLWVRELLKAAKKQ